MPTKAQVSRAQSLKPAIIEAFMKIGTVKPVAVQVGVSQEFVRKALSEAGIVPPRKGRIAFNWKGDGAGVDAGRARARVKYKLGPCQLCGKPATDRHHKDDNTLNNAPSNIAILCRRCHMKTDGRLERFRIGPRRGKPSTGTTCRICGDDFWPLRKGRCRKCALHYYAHGTERPRMAKALIAGETGGEFETK